METFRAFVAGWYDGSLQDVIFFPRQQPADPPHDLLGAGRLRLGSRSNPYTGPQTSRRLRALAEICRTS